MQEQTPVLIIARPGRMRDGLRAWLRAIPGLRLIGQANSGPAALEINLDCPPSLILLANNLPGDEIQTVLKQARVKWPKTHCLTLVDNTEQQGLAKAAGVGGVLFTGFSAELFFAAIQELLSTETKIGAVDR